MSDTPFEARANSGALFANKTKTTGSKQPDYKGYVLINQTRVQIAAWKRSSKDGAPYLSIQVDQENTPSD